MNLFKKKPDYKSMYEELLESHEQLLEKNKTTQKELKEYMVKYMSIVENLAVVKADYAERIENLCDMIGGSGTLQERIERLIQEKALLQEGLNYLKEGYGKRD